MGACIFDRLTMMMKMMTAMTIATLMMIIIHIRWGA